MNLNKKFVALDLRYLEKKYTGLSRYAINISKYLIKENTNKKLNYLIILPPRIFCSHLTDYINKIKTNSEIIYWDQKRHLRWKFPFFIFDIKLYYYLLKRKVGTYFCPYIDPPLLPGINVISTIHDTTPIDVKDYFQNFQIIKKLLYGFRLLITLYSSNIILTVSYSTKSRLISLYSKQLFQLKDKVENIKVIPNGVSLNKSNKDNIELDDFSKSKLTKNKYFLYVGDRRPHKNIQSIILFVKLYNMRFNKNFKLILAGSKSYKNFKLLSMINQNKRFILEIINPKDSLLDHLYNNCEALCFLSLSEGFGIPILEAAIRGKKIIANKIQIFKEVAPSQSLLIDPNDFENILEDINKYLNNDIFPVKQDIKKKWSWINSASLLSKILLSTMD